MMAADPSVLIGTVRDQDGRPLEIRLDGAHLRVDWPGGYRMFFHVGQAALLPGYAATAYEQAAAQQTAAARNGTGCQECAPPVPVPGPNGLYGCCRHCEHDEGYDDTHRIACPEGCNDRARVAEVIQQLTDHLSRGGNGGQAPAQAEAATP